MPTTHIMLEDLFTDPKYSITSTARRRDFIERIESGEIRSISSEWTKANLRLIGEEKTLVSAVERLPFSEEEKGVAFAQLKAQHKPLYRVGGAQEDGYWTIRYIGKIYEIYHYGDMREGQKATEIEAVFWRSSWLDDVRWTLVFDDILLRSRKEFHFIGVFRADVQNALGMKVSLSRRRPGRKPFVKDPVVAQYAKDHLTRHPTLLQSAWVLDIQERFPSLPERTRFLNLYGHIWTAHNKIRKSNN